MSLEWFCIVPETRDASQNEISGVIELASLQSGWKRIGTFLPCRLWGVILKQAVDRIISLTYSVSLSEEIRAYYAPFN